MITFLLTSVTQSYRKAKVPLPMIETSSSSEAPAGISYDARPFLCFLKHSHLPKMAEMSMSFGANNICGNRKTHTQNLKVP